MKRTIFSLIYIITNNAIPYINTPSLSIILAQRVSQLPNKSLIINIPVKDKPMKSFRLQQFQS